MHFSIYVRAALAAVVGDIALFSSGIRSRWSLISSARVSSSQRLIEIVQSMACFHTSVPGVPVSGQNRCPGQCTGRPARIRQYRPFFLLDQFDGCHLLVLSVFFQL